MTMDSLTSLRCPLICLLLLVLAWPSLGLRCYICGEYTDGVGSITPCINYTESNLKECSKPRSLCVKYVTEASIVRHCLVNCTEEVSNTWEAQRYCCNEDGCNGGAALRLSLAAAACVMAATFLRMSSSF